MRIDEENAAGGVHGRKLQFIVEDGQYQVPISVKAANKLLNRDKVFVMVGNMGTPMNNANMPRQLRMGVANLFPLTAAASMYEPLHPLKFAYYVSYRDQGVVAAFSTWSKIRASGKSACKTQATDYGHAVETGYNMAVDELGLESVYVGQAQSYGDGLCWHGHATEKFRLRAAFSWAPSPRTRLRCTPQHEMPAGINR